MQLSNGEIDLFYELYRPLLIYTNKKFGIIKGLNTAEDIRKLSFQEIDKVRTMKYKNPEIFDSFIAENPSNFSTDKLQMIRTWKNFVQGEFFICRYLKNYTAFLEAQALSRVYGVLALTTLFKEMVGPSLPVMVEITLLPFKDKIIYDGIFFKRSIHFGSGIRRTINDAYQKSKSVYGAITSLPFESPPMEQIDTNKLKYYLKNENNQEKYWDEIDELITKNSTLQTLYHQEMGKMHSRKCQRRLHEIGFSKAWFAILDDMIIASGTTKANVEQILQSILPEGRRKFVHLFQVKGK